jgi:F0F1-type ATP synthase membrane subunit a
MVLLLRFEPRRYFCSKGKQSFFEPLVVFGVMISLKGNIGHTSDKMIPYLCLVFFMILVNNVFGFLIPIELATEVSPLL